MALAVHDVIGQKRFFHARISMHGAGGDVTVLEAYATVEVKKIKNNHGSKRGQFHGRYVFLRV